MKQIYCVSSELSLLPYRKQALSSLAFILVSVEQNNLDKCQKIHNVLTPFKMNVIYCPVLLCRAGQCSLCLVGLMVIFSRTDVSFCCHTIHNFSILQISAKNYIIYSHRLPMYPLTWATEPFYR